MKISLKVVGSNGQISLGKEFAGRQVIVEEREPGVWVIRTVTVIPDDELWLYQAKSREDLQRALAWAQSKAPTESDPDATLAKLEYGRKRKAKRRSA
jgi:hypothetical protein